MIIASDGLFELLNNDDIAKLVAQWEDAQIKSSNDVKINVVNEPIKQDSFKYDQRYKQGLPCIKKDDNLATHLIRNALSFGGQEEFVDLMCSLKEPGSRKYRDDLTVKVKFFDDKKELLYKHLIIICISKKKTFVYIKKFLKLKTMFSSNF
mgnify:CR=1 FL=1